MDHFCKKFGKSFLGQNLAEIEHKFALTCRLLTGAALTTFDQHFAGIKDAEISNKTFRECVLAVEKTVFPANAIQVQKRYMH